MEFDLTTALECPHELPQGYHFLAWASKLLEAHADTKYRCFHTELDAQVFPCLGDSEGCRRLMEEISLKDGFLPAATWLVAHQTSADSAPDYCGTVQGIRDEKGCGGIQNVGITPEHRGRGVGTCLVYRALCGFREAGLTRVYLEVTAQNTGAVRLYRRLGFRKVRTVYKAAEVTYS
jgi:GNAT superfamily N-acetyltransferase